MGVQQQPFRRIKPDEILTVAWLIAHRKAVPSFCAACRDNFASIFGRHACAEAVYFAAAQLAGLVSAFHWSLKDNSKKRKLFGVINRFAI